jgi:hypothetical protein
MSAERSGRFHAVTWALCILAVPVVYLLTLPPIYCISVRETGPTVMQRKKWLEVYRAPHDWMCERIRGTSIDKLRVEYWNWWQRRTGLIS